MDIAFSGQSAPSGKMMINYMFKQLSVAIDLHSYLTIFQRVI